MDGAFKGPVGDRPPRLSIIVPAYNEARRLPATLDRLVSFAEAKPFPVEALVVDNASTDGTKAVVMDFVSRTPFVKYLHEGNRGKGAAVRTGVMAASGEYILFSDADLAVPIEEADNFLPPRLPDCDVAIGSREAKGARRHGEPFRRHLMGRVFNLIVQGLLLPGLRDTQCGFKCFRRDVARDLFAAGTVRGFGFDVEILHIARLRGYRIAEVPVQWHYGEESKVRPVRDTWRMLDEIRKIRRNGRRGLYAPPGARPSGRPKG
jgi:glycosyltransferase involved in cell wall biosynthesis